MDKFFENMDKRFSSIESELDYNYSNDNWQFAEKMLDDDLLDNSFIDASQQASVAASFNFESIDDAFLDDAFIEASSTANAGYASNYFADFKSNEATLVENDTFTSAAKTTNSSYQAEYWNAANIALQNEGLHHEYKTEYWAEAQKLLAQENRKGFFLWWSSVAIILLLVSFIGLNLNTVFNSSNVGLIDNTKESFNNQDNQFNQSNLKEKGTQQNITEKSVETESNLTTTNIENDQTNTQIETSNFVNDLVKEPNSKEELKQSKQVNPINVIETQSAQPLPLRTASIQSTDNSLTSLNPKGNTNNFKAKVTHKNIEKIKAQNLHQIATNKRTTVPELSKLSALVVKPIHQFGIKLEKGIGNVFTDENSSFSSRHALFLDYNFKPAGKLRNFEFGIETGLYHMNLDNLEYVQNYSVHKNHGGVDHMWAKLTYKDLIYLSTSVNTYYNINNQHKVKFAFGVDKLITSKIDMAYKTNLETISHTNNGEWGSNKGINTIDFTFGLGYEYKINSKFSFLLDTKFGTVDKTNNSYLRNTKMNRDLSVLFGLKYNIFASH